MEWGAVVTAPAKADGVGVAAVATKFQAVCNCMDAEVESSIA